jgi:hypothetical protein
MNPWDSKCNCDIDERSTMVEVQETFQTIWCAKSWELEYKCGKTKLKKSINENLKVYVILTFGYIGWNFKKCRFQYYIMYLLYCIN